MKRQPRSTIYMIALYALNHKGLQTFTAHQLWELGEEAHEHYAKNIPKEILERKASIIAGNGFTEDEWKEVLSQSGSFYFLPDERTQKTNREIKALFQNPKFPFMNSHPYTGNYCSALIKQAIRRGWFKYESRKKKPFTYSIQKQYRNPSFS